MKKIATSFSVVRYSVFAIAITIGMLACTAAHASLLIAQYHLGEADPGAVAGSTGDDPTIDSSGNGFDLTRGNTPTYSLNAAPGTGSTLSMAFLAADPDAYSRPAQLTTATTNVSIEAWAYPTAAPAGTGGYVALNGNGANGYGILDYGGVWNFIEEGVTFNSATPVVLNQWVDLKLVLDSNGTLTGYINGTLVVTQSALHAITPSSLFLVGSGFNGAIDEIAVYSPEPASASILMVSGLVLAGRRRR